MFKSFDLTKFGEHLRELRKSLDYTQETAANKSRLSIDTLRRVERGEVVPRYDTLIHLSLTYKKDLLAVLSSYSNANALFYFYHTLEDAILLNDLGGLEQLAQDFDDYMSNNSDSNHLVNVAAADQFRLMVSAIKKYYSSCNDNLDDCYAAMKISHPTFTLELFDQFNYTQFELRILFMIASSLSREKVNSSNEIMLFCLERVDESIHATFHEKLLRIKIYFNLSYNYHRIDDHKNALDVANKGIAFCNKNYLSHCLGALLYRKGIAQFHLSHPDYLETLQYSICILKIQDAHELAEHYKQVTYETYGITL